MAGSSPDVSWENTVMYEEIFGPILPVLSYEKIEDVIRILQKKPKPLTLYLFTEQEKIENLVLSSLSFGGGCVNDTLYHLANPYLPFGGVGASGTGQYHGEYTFNTFTHEKSIVKQTTNFDISARYPSSKISGSIITKLMK